MKCLNIELGTSPVQFIENLHDIDLEGGSFARSSKKISGFRKSYRASVMSVKSFLVRAEKDFLSSQDHKFLSTKNLVECILELRSLGQCSDLVSADITAAIVVLYQDELYSLQSKHQKNLHAVFFPYETWQAQKHYKHTREDDLYSPEDLALNLVRLYKGLSSRKTERALYRNLKNRGVSNYEIDKVIAARASALDRLCGQAASFLYSAKYQFKSKTRDDLQKMANRGYKLIKIQ